MPYLVLWKKREKLFKKIKQIYWQTLPVVVIYQSSAARAARQTGELKLQPFRIFGTATSQKKDLKKLKKVVDKLRTVWYDKRVAADEENNKEQQNEPWKWKIEQCLKPWKF